MMILAGGIKRLHEFMVEVRADVVDRVIAPVRRTLEDFLARVTECRYDRAQLDEDFGPSVLKGPRHELERMADGSEGLHDLVNALLRVAVAVELSVDGEQVVILDDPCVHVSRERTDRLVELLGQLTKRLGLQVIIFTHRPQELLGLPGERVDMELLEPEAPRQEFTREDTVG